MSDIEERFAALDRAIAELKREVMATNWKPHNRTEQMPCDPSASVVILSKDNFMGIIYLTPDYSSGSYLLMQRAIPPQPRGGCYAR